MQAQIADVTVLVFQTTSRIHIDIDGHAHPGPERPVQQSLLRITDTDGCAGYCLAQPAEAVRRELIDHYVRPHLIGADAFDREWLWQRLAREQRGSMGALLDRTPECRRAGPVGPRRPQARRAGVEAARAAPGRRSPPTAARCAATRSTAG